jgi:hypothetical protein
MPVQSNDNQINLALKALKKNPKLSLRKAAAIYNIHHTTLLRRKQGRTPRSEYQSSNRNLTNLEEQVIIERVLDLDSRAFSPRILEVEDR